LPEYICSECGKRYPIESFLYLCPECSKKQKENEPHHGVLLVSPDQEQFERFRKVGDPLSLLPVEREHLPDIPVGNTPLFHSKNLSEYTGFKNLYIKNDTLNPTGSLKDRASYLVSGFARKMGIEEIVLASTGNAASSMAGIGASAGQKITIFVPEDAPEAKLVQCRQYGADVKVVPGDYDRAYSLALEYADKQRALSRNTAHNPLTIDGKKTVSIEIFLQMGRMPENVFVPVGDGVIIAGVYRGFEDVVNAGLSSRMPKIFGVQAEGSDGICRIYETGSFEYRKPSTIADSISVGIPRNGYLAAGFLKKYKGECIRVSDDEILKAQIILSQKTGVFAEPSAAASLAGFLKVKERISGNESVVLLITGSGLKDIKSAKRALERFG